MVELGMEWGDVERLAADEVPIKGFEVPKIENQTMAFRDGPRVYNIRLQELKKLIRARSGGFELPKDRSAHGGWSRHWGLRASQYQTNTGVKLLRECACWAEDKLFPRPRLGLLAQHRHVSPARE
jgi:hypothetical protein